MQQEHHFLPGDRGHDPKQPARRLCVARLPYRLFTMDERGPGPRPRSSLGCTAATPRLGAANATKPSTQLPTFLLSAQIGFRAAYDTPKILLANSPRRARPELE